MTTGKQRFIADVKHYAFVLIAGLITFIMLFVFAYLGWGF